ncbi:1424_t:CDS:2 [Acaulospora morrowiae]|uniref:1424_t:CDS:1 n=1 Tax=Acaulospora morrowiae TaxID=94023 RepID=A0A9N9I0W8_9GLOM|nr:1424_t:CDS:2 [Acaulospora morrowiae]
MGCCSSRTIIDDDSSVLDGASEVPRGGNMPFTKKGVKWTSDSPITVRQLKKQRDAFWDTAPSYEGRPEIWQALRCACEYDDIVFAQAILNSANIIIPTGNLVNGCYDELGNKYLIPAYCIVEPTNLIYDDDNTSENGEEAGDEPFAEQLSASSSAEKTITIRLSNTSKDVKIKINSKLDTISTLRIKLCADQGLDTKMFTVRFFFLGCLLEDKTKLGDIDYNDGQVLQALISEKQ